MEVIPNPTTGITSVGLPKSADGLLLVYNISGQKVKTIPITRDTAQVPLDFEVNPAGLYWIMLQNKEGKLIGVARVSVIH